MKIRFEHYVGSVDNVNTVLATMDYDFDIENLLDAPVINAIHGFGIQPQYYCRFIGPFEDGSFSVDYGSYNQFVRYYEIKEGE